MSKEGAVREGRKYTGSMKVKAVSAGRYNDGPLITQSVELCWYIHTDTVVFRNDKESFFC